MYIQFKTGIESQNPFCPCGVDFDCTVKFPGDVFAVILEKQPPEIEWLTPGDIAQRLRSLREDHAAWRLRLRW